MKALAVYVLIGCAVVMTIFPKPINNGTEEAKRAAGIVIWPILLIYGPIVAVDEHRKQKSKFINP